MRKRIHDQEYNRGEWAELYVFLRLLGTGRLHAADSDLNCKADSFLEVSKVLRCEAAGDSAVYEVDPVAETVTVRRGVVSRAAAAPAAWRTCALAGTGHQASLFSYGGDAAAEADTDDRVESSGSEQVVSMADCEDAARILFDRLTSSSVGSKTMHAPIEVCDFVDSIGVRNPKAPGVQGRDKTFGGKADIVIETRDGRNSLVNRMGFSVKSQFGSPATLFNASPAAPLLYWVAHCDDALMREFNALHDIRGNRGWFACCQPFFDERGLRVSFARARNAGSFERNLLFIREGMLEIVAACVRERFIGGATTSDVAAITASVAEQNPMRYPPAVASAIYEKAMKDFLYAAFSGMSATKPWDGIEQVNGGYIVVKPDGDVLCYHANDREEFREYLFRNTVFEYVSAKKYGWSLIEKSDGEYLLPVNFSIRFKK
ncbi:HpaII family restriction endonuclease [uncultured Slackia sp.]|uniref:HpaII family restriction endonuclease n=1 Tax=uncultured Slackia sp. TaxID=665903 RepID=UPI0026E02042|nr:HpaII family restriction endonuclease [uncultured Slackia sp.]